MLSKSLIQFSLDGWGLFPPFSLTKDFPGGPDGKASVYNAGDLGSIPGLGRYPGKGNGNPLQYSYPGICMDRGARWASVHAVAESHMTE